MEAVRESWTDDRLDDLNGKVDALRVEMKTEFVAVRGAMSERFDKIDTRFDKMEKRFDKVDARFEKIDERYEKAEIRSIERFERMEERFDQRLDSLNHLLILFSGGVCAALITALAGLIATQL
jgi:hypothetical protein